MSSVFFLDNFFQIFFCSVFLEDQLLAFGISAFAYFSAFTSFFSHYPFFFFFGFVFVLLSGLFSNILFQLFIEFISTIMFLVFLNSFLFFFLFHNIFLFHKYEFFSPLTMVLHLVCFLPVSLISPSFLQSFSFTSVNFGSQLTFLSGGSKCLPKPQCSQVSLDEQGITLYVCC